MKPGIIFTLGLCLGLLFVSLAYAAPPPTVNLHGYLTAADGTPITGARAYVVRFYDAATDGAQIGTDLTGTVTVSDAGLFNLVLTPPAGVLTAAEVWYELGIDTDTPADGDASDDVFPGRQQVHSVPFARQADNVVHVDATLIGNGAVEDGEFAALDGVTGPIQGQLDAKADSADVYTKTEVDTSQTAQNTTIVAKANTADVYTKTEVDTSQSTQDTAIAAKADSADVYTKTEVDTSQTAQNTTIVAKANTADVYTKTEVDTSQTAQNTTIVAKANTADVYTKTEADTLLGDKANAASVYTKTEVDTSQTTQNTTIAAKANSAEVYTIGEVDASQAAQDTAIATKADSANVYTMTQVDASQATQDTSIAAKANAADVYTKTEVDASQATQDTAIAAKLPRNGYAYVSVEVTDNAGTNGTNLIAAYAAAKALTPHGLALSVTNRAAVLVPPGNYDLGTSQLTMDTEFVDVVGLSTARDDQYIYGTSNGPGTGVLRQTADDVRIENLFVECTRNTGGLSLDATDPAAYFPDSAKPLTVVRNCRFIAADTSNARSMRTCTTYSGKYTDCAGGGSAFGGLTSGVASGTFINCTGGAGAFGGGGGVASGTFTNCTGSTNAFGGGSSGVASGTFINCTGGYLAFGGGSSGVASGTFTGCTGENNAFGGNSSGVASGTFTNCTGGLYAFGGASSGVASGTFTGCRMTGGSGGGTFNGRMEDCRWNAGFTCGAAARIYRSTILGNVNLNGTAAGIAQSAVKGTIGNAGSAVFNSGNLEDTDVS